MTFAHSRSEIGNPRGAAMRYHRNGNGIGNGADKFKVVAAIFAFTLANGAATPRKLL